MLLWILLLLYTTNANEWILYSTDKTYGDYDCLFYDSRFFCRRPNNSLIIRESVCNGTVWPMADLKRNNVTTDMLFDWLHPHDNVERYARFLQRSSENNSILEDETLCNCSSNNFGVDCSYERTIESTINDVLLWQLSRPLERNMATITCLVDDIQCNAGLLCLEWRQVCDGIMQCEDGIDEENCHLLEFYRCASNEFQCHNGMCIPQEFLFDGTIDCMDKSDEQDIDAIVSYIVTCPTKSKYDCDEQQCKKSEFSCGDGQCIHWTNLISHQQPCQNRRDAWYRCETLRGEPLLSMLKNGVCRAAEVNELYWNLTTCTISLQSLFASYKRKVAFDYIVANCPSSIPIPFNSILTSNLQFFYNRSVIERFYDSLSSFGKRFSSSPHITCLTGSLICNGSKITLNSDYCFSYDKFLTLTIYPFFPISHIFCNVTSTIPLNVTIEPLSHRSNNTVKERFYQCHHSTDIISLRRMNDGYIDCLFGDDETNIDYLPINEPYRYQCASTDLRQYVSVEMLGNGVADCLDGSDELLPNLHWPFFRCEHELDYPCWVLRNAENIKKVQLLFHRYCDSIWDTMDGRDEQNCSHWVCPINMYQCNKNGQCIDRNRLCDGEFDCSNGEDEFKCLNKKKKPHWILEDACEDISEYFCITTDYLYDPHSNRPCIHVSKVGDGVVDCIGGRDERNVFSCSNHEMLGDRFVCDNKTQCISHRAICNGVNDCKDRSDEYICNWNQNKSCISGQFTCMDGLCVEQRCQNPKTGCILENEHLFWCPNETSLSNEEYRSTKIRRLSNYASFCNLRRSEPTSSVLTSRSNVIAENPVNKYDIRLHGYCNRGFYLLTKNGTLPRCFCPPSFYGDRCQFNRRRITVRFRLDRFSSLNIPSILHILVSLVYNDTTIVDHTTRVDIKEDFAFKHDMHLLYTRPKSNGSYTVLFEAYSGLNLLTAWEHAINPLDFLPVLRVTKILRFPDLYPQYCSVNLCKNNGICHIVNSYEQNRYICLCPQNWTGKHCEREQQSQTCSSTALIHHGGFCICPEGYLLPNCFIRNTVCDVKQPCLSNEICVPHSTMYGNHACLCTASNCRRESSFLTLTGENFTNIYPLVIQLLKFSSDYPRLRQQLLVSSLFQFPIIITIDIRDRPPKPLSIPEIGLLYTFSRTSSLVVSSMSLLYINCSNTLRNLTVDLDIQPRPCRSIEEPSPPVQLLHTYCRINDTYLCFYTINYICYCSTTNNGSECLSYGQRESACSHCLNHGFCAQGDLKNRSDFECVCPACVTGDLCQFSLKRFSVSFEWLIEKTHWGKLHLIAPVMFFTMGLVFNCLTIITLSKKKARSTGVGVILLLNSILSQLLLVLFVTRVVYLQLLRRTATIDTTNIILCKSLPYIMSSLSYFSSWLMALVSIERASIVQLSKTCHFFQTPKAAILVSVVIGIGLFGSLYKQIEQYKLVAHPNSNIWCIQEISVNEQILFQILSITHQLIPFLINVLSALVIIITIGRSKAASHHLPRRITVIEQARKRVNLLIGPFIYSISQLPQLIMLFLNPCTYDNNQWFSHVALIAYYITFAPHMSLFFMYIVPSPLYKELFISIVRRKK